MKTNVAVVIPNWNEKKFLTECLESLKALTLPHLVIVVDNGSTDGSKEYVEKNFPDVKVIQLEKNYGFAGGVNQGVEYAMKMGAQYIALLNNDAVVDVDWLKELVQEMGKNENIGIVTGKFLRTDGHRIDSTGDFYTTWGIPFPRGRDEKDNGQYDKQGPVFGATGGASLYRASLFRDIGLFDEDFFAYFEDVDISFRAQLAGWHVRYTPAAIAYHHVGGTSKKLKGFTRYHSAKNFILLYFKNMPGLFFWKYIPLFSLQLIRMFLGSIRDRQVTFYLKGVGSTILLFSSTLRKRRRVQRLRKVTPNEIDQMIHHGRPPRSQKL